MDAGVVVAIVVGGAGIVTTVYGLVSAKFTRLTQKIERLELAADSDRKTIAEVSSQRDALKITAALQDRFFSELPPNRRDRRGDSG